MISRVSFFSNKDIKKYSSPAFKSIEQKQSELPFYKSIDTIVYRGGRPSYKQICYLKNQLGVSTLIDFSTETFNGTSPKMEENMAKEIGLKYMWLPFCDDENPSIEQINLFLDTENKAKENNEKIYIHCFHGKSRTGLMAEIYRLSNGLASYEESIHTLLRNKYKFENNPLAVNLLKEFAIKQKRYI